MSPTVRFFTGEFDMTKVLFEEEDAEGGVGACDASGAI